jgi:hypothetical protein
MWNMFGIFIFAAALFLPAALFQMYGAMGTMNPAIDGGLRMFQRNFLYEALWERAKHKSRKRIPREDA